MKKNKLRNLALFLMGTAIFACQKDQIAPKENVTEQNYLIESKNISEIEQRILNFTKLMNKEQDEDRDRTMSVRDVVWDLEAGFNYDHRKSKDFNHIEVDSMKISLKKGENGEIGITNIRKEYEKVNENLINLTKTGGFLVVLDINIKNETENTVTFNVVSNIGLKYNFGNKVFHPQFLESWEWGFNAGICGSISTGIGLDAADIIPSRIGSLISASQIVTNISTSYLSNLNQVTPVGVNPFGFDTGPLFEAHGIGVTPDICITPPMLEYYESTLLGFAEDLRPAGKSTILHFLYADNTLAIFQWDHYHFAEITYATLTPSAIKN